MRWMSQTMAVMTAPMMATITAIVWLIQRIRNRRRKKDGDKDGGDDHGSQGQGGRLTTIYKVTYTITISVTATSLLIGVLGQVLLPRIGFAGISAITGTIGTIATFLIKGAAASLTLVVGRWLLARVIRRQRIPVSTDTKRQDEPGRGTGPYRGRCQRHTPCLQAPE